MKQDTRNGYNSFSLFRFLLSKWKILLIVFVAAAELSFVCSLFIKPVFRSTAIIYGPRTNAASKILLADETSNERLDIKAYAIEEETEQMMELLASRDIQDSIIQKFNLIQHYGLDTGSKYWQTKLYKYVKESMEIKRTKYGAISISFNDHDPKFACDITNYIVDMLDVTKRRIENERAAAAYKMLQKQLEDVNAEIARVDDSIQVIMKHGVYDFESQSERVTQQYAIAVAQGNAAAQQRLQAELDNLATWGPRAEALHDVQFNFRKYQSLVKQKMLDAKFDLENEIPTKFVVQRGIVPDKKVYPKKSIIMAVSSISAVIVTIILLLIIENMKGTPSLRPKEEENDAENPQA